MMGAYKNIQDILKVLWNDEELLRLLHYKPKKNSTNTPDPLDPSLPNILDIDENWEIRNDTIMLVPKESDLTKMESCKLFVYLGDGYANRGNPMYVNQSVIFDVFCHVDFENGDFRSARIEDRLKQLFAMEYVTSPWKMDFVKRRTIGRTPSQHVAYRFEYDFVEFKK
jgi:hypothetical protein